jgi:hypothetical protein
LAANRFERYPYGFDQRLVRVNLRFQRHSQWLAPGLK